MIKSVRIDAPKAQKRLDLDDPVVVRQVRAEAARLVREENLRRRLRRLKARHGTQLSTAH